METTHSNFKSSHRPLHVHPDIMATESSASQRRLSKTSMVPPMIPHSARDSVRNSALQVRNYADNEYAEHPPPPFQPGQDYYEDEDVVEDMNLEIDTAHASVAGAQNGYTSGVAPEDAGYHDDGYGYERRETYDEGPRDTQTSYAADYSAMGPDVHDKKRKWKGRVGGTFKGFKRRLFRRGRPAETFVSDGQRSKIPDIRVHPDNASHNGDRPYSHVSASHNPQQPGIGVVNNESTFYSTDAPTDAPPQSQPVTMMNVDAVPTDGGGGARSRRQSYAPPARLDSLRRDVENEAEFHNPEVILRSTSHVSQASQRSRLSQQSTTRNVHRERVPNPQIPPSLVPSGVPSMPFPMPYIPPPPPPPSAMKASTSSRRTSHSRSYFSSEISSPVGHFLHIHRLVRDIRQMPWLATGGRITSGYVPKFSSARAKERMSRSRRVQAEMEHVSGAASWYTPSPKQREKMERNQRRREKYLKHHDHDHDAVQRLGKNESSRHHHEHRPRHFSSNSTSPGRSTPSRRHSSKARRHRSSFRNRYPYYMPSTQSPFAYPYPYGTQPMYMISSPPNTFSPGPPLGRPATAQPIAQGLAPPDAGKDRASRPASVASRMTVTQDSRRGPARDLPTPPQAQAVYMFPAFMSPPGSPVPSAGQAGMPFPQPIPFPYPPSSWPGVPPPSQQPNLATG